MESIKSFESFHELCKGILELEGVIDSTVVVSFFSMLSSELNLLRDCPLALKVVSNLLVGPSPSIKLLMDDINYKSLIVTVIHELLSLLEQSYNQCDHEVVTYILQVLSTQNYPSLFETEFDDLVRILHQFFDWANISQHCTCSKTVAIDILQLALKSLRNVVNQRLVVQQNTNKEQVEFWDNTINNNIWATDIYNVLNLSVQNTPNEYFKLHNNDVSVDSRILVTSSYVPHEACWIAMDLLESVSYVGPLCISVFNSAAEQKYDIFSAVSDRLSQVRSFNLSQSSCSKLIEYCGRLWRVLATVITTAQRHLQPTISDSDTNGAPKTAIYQLLDLLAPPNTAGILTGPMTSLYNICGSEGIMQVALFINNLAKIIVNYEDWAEHKRLLKFFRNQFTALFSPQVQAVCLPRPCNILPINEASSSQRFRSFPVCLHKEILRQCTEALCNLMTNLRFESYKSILVILAYTETNISTNQVASSHSQVLCKLFDCCCVPEAPEDVKKDCADIMIERLLLHSVCTTMLLCPYKQLLSETSSNDENPCKPESKISFIDQIVESIYQNGLFHHKIYESNNLLSNIDPVYLITSLEMAMKSLLYIGDLCSALSEVACISYQPLLIRCSYCIHMFTSVWQSSLTTIALRYVSILGHQNPSLVKLNSVITSEQFTNLSQGRSQQIAQGLHNNEDLTQVLLTCDGSQEHHVASSSNILSGELEAVCKRLFAVISEIWTKVWTTRLGSACQVARERFLEAIWWFTHRLTLYDIRLSVSAPKGTEGATNLSCQDEFVQSVVGELLKMSIYHSNNTISQYNSTSIQFFPASFNGKFIAQCTWQAIDSNNNLKKDCSQNVQPTPHKLNLRIDTTIEYQRLLSRAIRRCVKGITLSNYLSQLLVWLSQALKNENRLSEDFIQYCDSANSFLGQSRNLHVFDSSGSNANQQVDNICSCIYYRTIVGDNRVTTRLLCSVIEKCIVLCQELLQNTETGSTIPPQVFSPLKIRKGDIETHTASQLKVVRFREPESNGVNLSVSVDPETVHQMRLSIQQLLNLPFILMITGQYGVRYLAESAGKVENTNLQDNWGNLVSFWYGLLEADISYQCNAKSGDDVPKGNEKNGANQLDEEHECSIHDVFYYNLNGACQPSLRMECGGVLTKFDRDASMSAIEFSSCLRLIGTTMKYCVKYRNHNILHDPSERVGHRLALVFVNLLCGWCDAVKACFNGEISLKEKICVSSDTTTQTVSVESISIAVPNSAVKQSRRFESTLSKAFDLGILDFFSSKNPAGSYLHQFYATDQGSSSSNSSGSGVSKYYMPHLYLRVVQDAPDSEPADNFSILNASHLSNSNSISGSLKHNSTSSANSEHSTLSNHNVNGSPNLFDYPHSKFAQSAKKVRNESFSVLYSSDVPLLIIYRVLFDTVLSIISSQHLETVEGGEHHRFSYSSAAERKELSLVILKFSIKLITSVSAFNSQLTQMLSLDLPSVRQRNMIQYTLESMKIIASKFAQETTTCRNAILMSSTSSYWEELTEICKIYLSEWGKANSTISTLRGTNLKGELSRDKILEAVNNPAPKLIRQLDQKQGSPKFAVQLIKPSILDEIRQGQITTANAREDSFANSVGQSANRKSLEETNDFKKRRLNELIKFNSNTSTANSDFLKVIDNTSLDTQLSSSKKLRQGFVPQTHTRVDRVDFNGHSQQCWQIQSQISSQTQFHNPAISEEIDSTPACDIRSSSVKPDTVNKGIIPSIIVPVNSADNHFMQQQKNNEIGSNAADADKKSTSQILSSSSCIDAVTAANILESLHEASRVTTELVELLRAQSTVDPQMCHSAFESQRIAIAQSANAIHKLHNMVLQLQSYSEKASFVVEDNNRPQAL